MAEGQDSVLRELGECPICSEEYSLEQEPKQLPCSHTVCLLCLERMVEVAASRVGYVTGDLCCPLCRNGVKLPPGGPTSLPTNRLVLNFMEVLNLGEVEVGTGGDGYKCNFCRKHRQDRDKILYCKDCGKYICEACSEKHKQVSRFRKHCIVLTSDSTVVCQNHKEMFRHLCLTDNRLLCDICIHEGVCQDHDVDDLHQVAGSREENLRTLISDIIKDIGNINQYTDPQVAERISDLVTIKESVHKHTEAVINKATTKARSKEKKLLQQMQKFYEKLIDVKKETQNMRLGHLQSLKQVAEAVLEKGAEHIVVALPNIRAKMQNVETISYISADDHHIVNSHIHFEPVETLDIGEIIVNYNSDKSDENVIHQGQRGRKKSMKKGDKALEGLAKDTQHSSPDGSASQSPQDGTTGASAYPSPESLMLPNYRIAPQLTMESGGLADGWDVTFLPSGRIAMTDKPSRSGSCRVLLYSIHGNLEADSSQRGVQLRDPRGITYHHTMCALIIADQGAGCLLVLDAADLSHKRNIGLSGMGSPWGVAVLSDGDIVVAGWHSTVGSPGVGVFGIDGHQVAHWGTWGRSDGQFHSPWYVSVNRQDHILVSDRVNQCVQIFARDGTFLVRFGDAQSMPMPWGLCSDPLGNILVACVGGATQPPHVSVWTPEGRRILRLLHWSAQEKESRGWLMSVSLRGDMLAVVGNNKLLTYKCALTSP